MLKFLTKLALLAILFMPTQARAQTVIHLSSVSVDIWPEYDQPAVLVITHITMAPGTALPASLTLRIPAGGTINAVAIDDPVKGLINAPYDNTIQGKWSALTITANSLKVQVEYYEALNKNGTSRHIVYDWASDEAVDSFQANFLLPIGAENLTITPIAVNTGPRQDGLTNYLTQAANLPAGQPFSVTIDYQRQSDELRIASLPVEAVSTPGPNTPGRMSMPVILPWVLAGIGVLLIVVGAFVFIKWQRSGQRSGVRQEQTSHLDEMQTKVIYCHECGKRAQLGDVFCRTCGARLKQEQQD